MNKARAEEILNSPEMIYVTYQNIPVWIDQLQNASSVVIRDFNSDIQMEVPLEELDEVNL